MCEYTREREREKERNLIFSKIICFLKFEIHHLQDISWINLRHNITKIFISKL